jgi:hypothetical protein
LKGLLCLSNKQSEVKIICERKVNSLWIDLIKLAILLVSLTLGRYLSIHFLDSDILQINIKRDMQFPGLWQVKFESMQTFHSPNFLYFVSFSLLKFDIYVAISLLASYEFSLNGLQIFILFHAISAK